MGLDFGSLSAAILLACFTLHQSIHKIPILLTTGKVQICFSLWILSPGKRQSLLSTVGDKCFDNIVMDFWLP